MADFIEIQESARIQALDTNSHSGGHHTSPYYAKHNALKQQAKPPARTSVQIKDAAFVMGIPIEEITPRVHEAVTLIMHEMDSVRWELAVARKHEAFLTEALDHHGVLPVYSLAAFYQYLSHAIEHVGRTKEPSFLLFFKILGVDELWSRKGAGLRDGFLNHSANVIKGCFEDVDVVGALDHGEFGVIMNLYQEEAVKTKAMAVSQLVSNAPFVINGETYPIKLSWGIHEILDKASPAQIILAANEQARHDASVRQ